MDRNSLKDNKSTDRSVNSILPCILGFSTFTGCSAFFRLFWPLYLKQHGFDAAQLGLLYIPRITAGIFGSLTYGFLANRYLHPRTLSMLSFVVYTTSTLSLGFVSTYPKRQTCYLASDSNNSSFLSTVLNEKRSSTKLFSKTSPVPFLILQGLLLLTEFAFSMCRVVLIHATMITLGPMQYHEFGKSRAWGDLSTAAMVLLTGIILNEVATTSKICGLLLHQTDYGYIFHIFAVVAIAGCFNSTYLFPKTASSPGRCKDQHGAMTYGQLVSQVTPDSLSWLILYALRSVFYGVSEVYLPWHLENIGTSPFVIGVCGSVRKLSAFVSFLCSSWVIRQLGYLRIAVFATFSYTIRFVAFGVMENGLVAVPFSLLEGAVIGCFSTTVTSKISSFYPVEGQSPLHGLLTSIQVLSVGLGYVSGGLLMKWFGAHTMFLIYAMSSALTFVFFNLFQCCCVLAKN